MPENSKNTPSRHQQSMGYAKFEDHLEVSLAADPNEECAKDLWDMR